jgi:serine/threonine protein kinase
MGQPIDSRAADVQEELEQAIAAYLDESANGRPFDRDAWLAAHPGCAAELRQFLQDHDRVMQAASPWRPAVELESDGPLATADTPVARGLATIEFDVAAESPGPSSVVAGNQSGDIVRFGDYELLHVIGRGGMGIVYKARQLSLNRIVAIKMILQGRFATADDVERFQLEAQAAAKLEHPNIVVVHEVGVHGEQHFFSMEYVEGQSLGELARSGPLPPRRVAHYVQQVAEAVHFAHQNGVLHRDIKPSNVLVDNMDRARVMDFGLARHVDRTQKLTITGQILGTPTYMAPEQITNRKGELGPACDVYGLGTLLYELLTGQPPFKGRDQFETLLHVLDREPPLPRRHNPAVPRELELICLKCLEKDPRQRYPTAKDVADDLARYLSGDSISLSSPKLVDRLVRTLERSQYDQEVHAWSRMLIQFAWIALVTHLLVYLNRMIDWPHPLGGLVAIRALEVMGLGAVLWHLRRQWYPPRGAPARQLWSLGLGYIAGSLVLLIVTYLLTPANAAFDDARVYPPMAVLTGLLFIMLGSSYWGYCYVIGSVFFTLAVVMTFFLDVGPLLYGIAWAASLAALAIRLGRLAGKE